MAEVLTNIEKLLDEKAITMKKITLEMMMEYIDKKAPNDKAWFKNIAYQDKNGNAKTTYQHLNAVKRFCERYDAFRGLIPVKKEKTPNKSEQLMNW